MKLEIEPHEWESGKILRIVYGDKTRETNLPRTALSDHHGLHAPGGDNPVWSGL